MDERRVYDSGSEFERKLCFSRGVAQGPWVFISGTTGYDYLTHQISPKIEEQAEQTFKNIEKALRELGAGWTDVVRVTYIVTDFREFGKCEPIIQKHLGGLKMRPAATAIEARLISPEMKFEMEVTALKGSA